ncbi:MAG: threonine/serine dehydratase [Cohaesibacter sp.]|nr:threonine/serine dehydratase [Cohaesibacter sp.]
MLDLSAILGAQSRLESVAVRTPFLSFASLNERLGGTVFFKAECLQRKGAFKFRGAYNAISLLSEDERTGGIVACSSGNHAQGVAEAARLFGIPAAIVMPQDAPMVKVRGTKASGAEVIFYDRYHEDREAIAKTLCAERGAHFLHPFNDLAIMAGQGTCGLEMAEDLLAMGQVADLALVPMSGGGLAAGVSVALHGIVPDCEIIACEPAGHDDFKASLAAGKPSERLVQEGEMLEASLCDALLAPRPGDLTFDILKDHIGDVVTADNQAVLQAMKCAMMEMNLVVEPGGAIGLAALLNGSIALEGRTAVVVLSGGNADKEILQRALAL